MKVLMLPQLNDFHKHESGIRRVIEGYWKFLPAFGIELVDNDVTSYDIKAVHAGMTGPDCTVAHLHGIYFTADYDAPRWEYDSNRRIVEAVRQAKEVTVPSRWVAETFQRDMRFTPHITPHGIEWQEWQHDYESQGYVLWNKNRLGDVCDPAPLQRLATIFPEVRFVTTFATREQDNISSFDGLIPHNKMKQVIQQAEVYLATTKETFGLGTLEAMASGIPVLGWNVGGNVELVEHGINGYLAEYGSYDDLAEGLNYCLKHGKILGVNGRELAKKWTWEKACEQVANIYRLALQEQEPLASVVIPIYNKSRSEVIRAISSCLQQSLKPREIIVINDGSNSNYDYYNLESMGSQDYYPVRYIEQSNQGVANARNNGISLTTSKYICCLDADDWIAPNFLEICINALESDRSLGVAYTGLYYHKPDGSEGISPWPSTWSFDRHIQKANQIPTCCVFRKEMWERLGGYRQRYAPKGAGAEDAEFWLRAGAYGYKAAKVAEDALFHYSWMSGQVTGDPNYQEVDWLAWHPWTKDGLHPFASHATPKNGLSHPVRQYDEPIVSVIIPVGTGHERQVIDALDSIEAQTFRKWEAIVIDDTIDKSVLSEIIKSYPYVNMKHTIGMRGAGVARNQGAKMARAPFLLFLDADDTLHPEAIQKMLEAWNTYKSAIYTNYVGEAFIDDRYAKKLQKGHRLLSYDPDDGKALIAYEAANFDCYRALNQPNHLGDMYLWNNITTLIPRSWHNEIGGFDEEMETWEDWEYWLRMAKHGHCFQRLPEQLLRYRFYTGNRRDLAAPDNEYGRQTAQKMIEYVKQKHSALEVRDMGCGCGKSTVNGTGRGGSATSTSIQTKMNDGDFIRAKYSGRSGNHHITGAYRFDRDPGLPSRKVDKDKWVLYYGYKSKGYVTLVHKEDIKLMVGKWEAMPEIEIPKVEKVIVPEPELIAGIVQGQNTDDILGQSKQRSSNISTLEEFDLQSLPGITPAIAERMKQQGIDTPDKIINSGLDGLQQIKGIAESRAKAILKSLTD